MELVFREYQKRMREHGINNLRFGLFAEMGLGKTAVMLSIIKYLMKVDFSVKKPLIICPKKVVNVCVEERNKWDEFFGIII